MRMQFATSQKKESVAQSHAQELMWQRALVKSYSDQHAQELIEKFVRNQTWQVPTLILLKNDAFPASDFDPYHDPRTTYIPKGILANWETGTRAREKETAAQEFLIHRALFEKSSQMVGKMQSADVPIMAGTDSTAPYIFPGSSLHEELQLLVQAGLTPMQALQSATKNPAEFMDKLKIQGTIERGKFADLLLLDANPLDAISNTKKSGP
jgi:imidazolonepropionase-like amidohydrolase